MTRFIVETYVPAHGHASFQQATARLGAASSAADVGARLRWIESYVVPEDEIGFVVLEARAFGDVVAAAAAAGLEADRIVIAIDIETGLGAGIQGRGTR